MISSVLLKYELENIKKTTKNERRVASIMWTFGTKSGSLRWPRARPEVACVLLFWSEAVPWCTGNPLSVFAPQKT